MIIVKLTIILTLLVVFLIMIFRAWYESHPLSVRLGDYPFWAYIMAVLIMIDVIGIFVSVVWYLFFYL